VYKLAINRPIATLMYVLTLVIFGYMSFKAMPSALLPNVDFPMVTVKTIYPGADPETVESEITEKIEEAVSSIGGIDNIRSISGDGVSVVTIKFKLERKIEDATNDVRDKVSAIILPRDAKKPLVSKLDIGAAPVIKVFLTAQNASKQELMLFADQKAKIELQKINGVGSVNIVGYQDREIKIFPKLDALDKYNITARELNALVQAQNVKLGGGKLITKEHEYILKVKADAKNVEDLKNIYIKNNVKLKDIATVVDTLSDPQSYSSMGGKAGVTLEVQKISGTNTLEVIKRVKETIPTLKKLAGEKFGVQILQDTSPFIIQSLKDVEFDLIYGAILAVIIVFVFLRNFTITLVSALTIPISIFGTIALMHLVGYELNKMTLIGLTLAIGIIIDDAIVVMEYIYKKLEEGHSKFEAAYLGAKEMAFPVLAISSMLLAVFIPVANMSGIVGTFFKSFAMTVAFAIIISYTVVMSFIPSFSARVLSGKQSWFYRVTEPIFRFLDKLYLFFLKPAVKFSIITLVLAIVSLVFSLKLFPQIGMDFLPKEDKSEFEVYLKATPGISLEKMIQEASEVEKVVQADKNVLFTTLSVAYNSTRDKNKALIYVKLLSKDKRKLNQTEIIELTRKKLAPFNKKFKVTVAAIPNIKGAGVSVPYQIILKGDDFAKLKEARDKLMAYLAKKKGFKDIDSDFEDGRPQIDIFIKRDIANTLGISAAAIAQTINIAFSSDIEISKIEQKGKLYNITLRVDDEHRKTIADIKRLQVRAANGSLVYLDSLLDFNKTTALNAINHYDREREIMVLADLYGLDLGSAIKYTDAKINEILPKGVSYKYSGFAEELGKTIKAFATAVALALILMYIILAVLYESLIQPFIIMVTLPLSIVGVMLALYVTHVQFSLYVMIGTMLLMGMVGKNAVLIVEVANELVQKGADVKEALYKAGESRLRPILMTTIAMVFAMIPLAVSNSLGSESKAPMAIAVIGGLLSSMVLTLIVVPALYRLIYPLDRWLRKWYETGKVE
jgi:HAE1 family hydrophobic/amphiphilic exporter-1